MSSEPDPTRLGPTWQAAERVLRLLDGRWTMSMLAELAQGPRRYLDLFESLDGISHKVLTETLRRAERGGLVTRVLNTDSLRSTTVYQLTSLAGSLDAALHDLAEWANINWPTVEVAREEWGRRSD